MTDIKFEFDSTAVCRICLQGSDEEMISIYERDSADNTQCIYEKIEKCAGIKVINRPELPAQICTKCKAFLNLAYKFRTICKHSDTYLREFVCKATVETTISTVNDSTYIDSRTEYEIDDENIYYLDDTLHDMHTNAATASRQSEQPTEIITDDCTVEYEELNDYVDVNCWDNEDDDDDEDGQFIVEDANTDGENSNTWPVSTAKKASAKTTPAISLPVARTTAPTAAPPMLARRTKLTSRIARTNNNNTTSTATNPTKKKTLGITSDGAAVIHERGERLLGTKEVHICEVCGNSYPRKYALEVHMRRHTNEKPFECELCGQAFHFNFQLTRHIRKHTGARPYACQYCKRRFTDRSTMVKHERIHRNERPYMCGTCGKTFTYSSVLKVHLLTHTGEKPFSCGICEKRFARSHHLRAHLETLLHHNDPRAKELLTQIKRVEQNLLSSN